MKKLPIGIQTFFDIRADNYCYADKTDLICQLVDQGRYFFLSRPRRFGKSLLLDTIAEAFSGNKKLFSGLYLEKKWDWEIKYPVIKIDFAQGVLSSKNRLDASLLDMLKIQAALYEINLEDNDIQLVFGQLIREIHQKTGQRVVVLVDEYDKPILDNITNLDKAIELREGLRNIYSVLKAQGAHLRFVMLTGVSKFAKVSIFSGLNNLKDITLDSRYATICGYTQDDLETVFSSHLAGVDMGRVREWYNGYNFFGERVYNPFDILLFIDKGFIFDNYWFATGTPTFLLKLIKQNNYYLPRLSNLRVDSSLIDSFDIENIKLEPIMFQAGYLTIKDVHELEFGGFEYSLQHPNKEVALSFNDVLIRYLTDETSYTPTKSSLFTALKHGDLDRLQTTFISLFASIPYNNYVKNTIGDYEGCYASVIYAYLASLGIKIITEDVSNKGRIDLTVFLNEKIYIIEFKVDGKDKPLQQIKEREYAQKYQGQGDIYLVGIKFSSEERNIVAFEWERVK
jgi:hypothetical protein